MVRAYPVDEARSHANMRFARCQRGKLFAMPGWDDDDWVGEPPEGRYTRDRAKPEFWRQPWPLAGAGMAILIVIVVIVLVLQ